MSAQFLNISRLAALCEIEAQRICIIKPSALGDVVQTLPLLPALRRKFPEAHLSWVINRELIPILEQHPHLDEIVPFDRNGGFRSWFQLCRRLRHGSYDLVFDLQGLLRTGIMTWATRAPLRVGLETAREGANRACHITLPQTTKQMPAHARYWRVAEALGVGHLPRETFVAFTSADKEWADAQAVSVGGRILVIHPGARWVTKRWPPEKFADVAVHAMRMHGFGVIVVGSPGELTIANEVVRRIEEHFPNGNVQNLAGRSTLKQLAALLQRANLMLSNDSGPMHLAAGLGTPVVSVFTCTSPVFSGPPGDVHRLVSTRLPCGASYCKTCPHKGDNFMECHRELTTERVRMAFDEAVIHLEMQPRSA